MPSNSMLGCVAVIFAPIAAFVVAVLVVAVGTVSAGGKYRRQSAIAALVVAPIACCVAFLICLEYVHSGAWPPSPSQKPSATDIAGAWEFSEGGLGILRQECISIPRPTLNLESDCTFEMTDMPLLMLYLPGDKCNLVNVSGTWKFMKDINGDWTIELSIAKVDNAPTAFRAGTHYDLLGKNPPYKLYQWWGDPDDGVIVTLERR